MSSPYNLSALKRKKNDIFEITSNIFGGINMIQETKERMQADWEIFNFLEIVTRSKNWNGKSPLFTWLSIIWQLEITYTSGNEIRLFLHKSKSENRLAVALKFGIRLLDGSSEMRSYHTKNFSSVSSSWGTYEIILESELIKRKKELMPVGNLTLSCSMVLLDVMTQSKKRKYACADALSSDLMALFETGKNSDMTIVVGDQNYPVHTTILAARSNVFAVMFQQDMKEVNSGIINVTDCEPNHFKDFLLYLYTGKVQKFTPDNVGHLYRIADKYNVQDLKNLCVDYIIKNLSALNLFDIVILAEQFNDMKLICAVESFFSWNALEITESDDWEHFVKENFPIANKYLRKALSKSAEE